MSMEYPKNVSSVIYPPSPPDQIHLGSVLVLRSFEEVTPNVYEDALASRLATMQKNNPDSREDLEKWLLDLSGGSADLEGDEKWLASNLGRLMSVLDWSLGSLPERYPTSVKELSPPSREQWKE